MRPKLERYRSGLQRERSDNFRHALGMEDSAKINSAIALHPNFASVCAFDAKYFASYASPSA